MIISNSQHSNPISKWKIPVNQMRWLEKLEEVASRALQVLSEGFQPATKHHSAK